ncbi:uncharacterized protein BO97DRAFT_464851 [Aspergillus homomorphus CBS 101889]|uniref:Uncharacterized protein n=1 Tax=Aspergillus homomorphus (strain CBS 101889) TaxID=1450537 RepID=A0A395HHJ6_ASPHC|nr:hypothetical protein BO97DRAFT_464851 [Aspergillus homomorphus CBS 101889]RAL06973.1 hypothetical protein BO97DRAFT_464851 [Aspergillus homomorphus CBS 101889]
MPALENLTLWCNSAEGLTVRDIFENVQMPSLRQLELDGITLPIGERTASAVRKVNQACSPTITKGTAQFSTLNIHHCKENPAAIEELILWPKALTHFNASVLSGSGPACDVNLSKLNAWLLAHKDTLQTIQIRCIYKQRQGQLFHTRGFVALERLTLPWWEIRGNFPWREDDDSPFVFTPAHADAILCAPRLETLELDFGQGGHGPDYFGRLGEIEDRWIRDLACAALARQAALRTICVGFKPRPYDLAVIIEYPWDRLNRLREDLQPLGIMLEYTEPTFSEEEWVQARMRAFPPWDAMRGSESPPLDDGMFGGVISKDVEPTLEEQEAWEAPSGGRWVIIITVSIPSVKWLFLGGRQGSTLQRSHDVGRSVLAVADPKVGNVGGVLHYDVHVGRSVAQAGIPTTVDFDREGMNSDRWMG